jgi:hypothetical protein
MSSAAVQLQIRSCDQSKNYDSLSIQTVIIVTILSHVYKINQIRPLILKFRTKPICTYAPLEISTSELRTRQIPAEEHNAVDTHGW